MRLPLYPQAPQAVVGWETERARDSSCTRCERHEGTRNVCLQAEGKPGGLYVLFGAATRDDDNIGRPFTSQMGKYLRSRITKHWKHAIAYDNAVRCPGSLTEQSHIDACRPYTAQLLREVRPTRIIAVGPDAAESILGRRPPVHELRRGYGWWIDEETYPDPESFVPVYVMPLPKFALTNRFIAKQFEDDLAWALTAPVPEPTMVGRYTVTVHDGATAAAAMAELRGEVIYDTETSGVVFDKDFRIETITLWAAGSDHGFTWDRDAIENPKHRKVLVSILENVDTVGHNLKYDTIAVLLEFGIDTSRRMKRDTRLSRKLLDGEVGADLENAAETVGMGGHKGEAQDALELIKKDLAKLAGEPLQKPLKSGKPRKPYEPKYVQREHVPEEVLQKLRAGRAKTIQYAYRFMNPTVRVRYNARDAASTDLLDAQYTPRLMAKKNLVNVWEKVTLPAMQALVRIEREGVHVDRIALDMFEQYLDSKIQPLEAQLKVYGDINYDSPKQLSELLFGKLRLPRIDGNSTDAEVLHELEGQHPIIASLLEYRHLVKVQSTNGRGARAYIRDDGRIHTTFLLDGAGCLPAGELVLTNRGYIPAEKVRVGDQVIAHTGVPRLVIATCVNAPSEIYRVTLSNGLELRTTADHKYLRPDGEWKRADALVKGELVLAHSLPEQWRHVKGWTAFEVSSWGRVRNKRTGNVLALQPKGRWGHLKVCLHRNGAQTRGTGDRKDFGVHRLVAGAFCIGKKQVHVRHMNGIAWDNTAGNLKYGTSSENHRDASRHGTLSKRRMRHPQLKLSEEIVAEIRATSRPTAGGGGRWSKIGVSDSKLAQKYGVARETIRDIRSGKRWQSEEHIVGARADFFEVSVVSVQREAAEPTYGATVDIDHSHVTGGVVTHNTGRMSSKNPNLQNIPSPDRDPVLGKMSRDIFIAPPGYMLVEADYSQLELRIAAMLSQDPVMIEMFLSGHDFHERTAQLVAPVAWNVTDWDALTPELKKQYRRAAKSMNFQVNYDLEPAFKLGKTLGIPTRDAEKFVALVFGKFRKLKQTIDNTVAAARKHGGVFVYLDGQPANWRPLPMIGESGADESRGRLRNASNAAWNCLDDETEALTRRGWVRGFELTMQDELLTKNPATGVLEWQLPTDLKLWPDYVGDLYEFRSASFHAVTTPDHRWLTFNKSLRANVVRTSATISKHGDDRIHRTGLWSNTATYGNDFVELAGWFLTDGYIKQTRRVTGRKGLRGPQPKPGRAVGLCQSARANPQKVARIDALLQRERPIATRRVVQRDQLVHWDWREQDLVRLFPTRELTHEFVASLDGAQAQLLLDTMIDGDGSRSGGKLVFITRSEATADAFQALCVAAGKASSLKWRDMSKYKPKSRHLRNVPRMTGVWAVTVLKRDKAQVMWHHWRSYRAKASVWCPIVPNTFFVVRRSGHVFITGNTPVQGTAAHYATRSLDPIQQRFDDEGLDATVVLTVHDSIMAKVRDDQVAESIAIMGQVMSGWYSGGVPLKVDFKYGRSWGSMIEVKD